LDLDACVWLANHLAEYKKMLLVISHSQDFLNDVTTHTMVLQRKKLKTWGGSYSTYVKTKAEQDQNQMKLYEKQQEEIAHIKSFIASCGTYANLVRQAQSRQKVLDKMIADGLIEKPYNEPKFVFNFPPCGELPPPLISVSDVSFSYSGKKEDYLFSKINFGISSDSRICLVGPNGAGKSTLLKLLDKELSPTEGNISTKGGVTVARYTQHSDELLDYTMSPVDFMRKSFKDRYPKYEEQQWRGMVGSWGLHSDYHYQPISILSAGLKQRLVFAYLAATNPHVLLLDEPTNAADMSMIDSMADAINKFEGAVICVSHDFALLSQIAREIWVVDHGVTIWKGDIRSYKEYLSKQVGGGSKGSATAGTGGAKAAAPKAAAGAGAAKAGAGGKGK
jgi:ATP-binding cassette, subfamily F, member 2